MGRSVATVGDLINALNEGREIAKELGREEQYLNDRLELLVYDSGKCDKSEGFDYINVGITDACHLIIDK